MRDSLRQVIENAVNAGCYIEWAPDYVEPGYSLASDAGIYFANWNPKEFTPRVDTIESRIGALLEQEGVDIEWSDEWSTCPDCGRAFRTQPDSYSWLPNYAWIGDCEKICRECIETYPAQLEEELIDNPDKADTFGIDWSELGWEQVTDVYETGFHPGQNDDPHKVYDKLSAKGYQVLFSIDSTGQFDTRWSAWIRLPE